MLTKLELENYRRANVCDYNEGELFDIENLTFDKSRSVYNRANYFFDCVKNPYAFRVGDVCVNVNFKGESELQASVIDAVMNSVN